MRSKRRALRLATYTTAAMAVAAGALAVTASAGAQVYNATTAGEFVTDVAAANSAGGANTINLAVGVYAPTATVTVTAGTLTIQGPAQVPTANSNGAVLDGASIQIPGTPLLKIASGATANLVDLEVTNGGGNGAPAVDSFGTANLTRATIAGNTGAGLFVEPNAASTIVNSTLSDGLDFGLIDQGTASLTNVTVVRNSNGGIDDAQGALHLTNSIVAKDGFADCTRAVPAGNSDHSLSGDNTCGVGALASRDPLLGAINTTGGSTPTDVPSATSPALDAGNPAACPAVDQRGAPRPDDTGTACDIGAVERYSALTLTNANQTVGTTSAGGKTVNYTQSWRAGAPFTSTCSPASGTNFAVGSTTVTCNGNDAFGNAGTGTFTVQVIQYTNPTVTTSPPTQTVAAVDATGATATFTATATDTVDGTLTPTCDHASGSKFPVGTTTVTCTATNSGGLAGSRSLTVTVADQAPPVITVPADITAVGSGTAVTYNPAPSATDNVDGTDPVTCAPPSGSTFPVGTTTVTCNAKDAANNSATPKTFTVTITNVGPDHTNATVQGEVPNGGSPGGLQITAGTCEFGPVFIPGLAGTYDCSANVSVTSSDSTTLLTINDVSTAASKGHLVNPAGTGYALASSVLDMATSATATGGPFTALTGTAGPLLNYTGPVTADPVTLKFRQAISAIEPLHNGTYGATVLLQLSGTP